MYFNFRTWRDYISKDGTILFPKMARLRFRTWHDFTSEHGAIALPNLYRT